MGREGLVVGGGPPAHHPAPPSSAPGGPTRAELAHCLTFLADALTEPPRPADLTRAARMARDWPLTDAESLRGTGLLGESALAGESPERLRRDHDRLFVSRVTSVVPGRPIRISTPLASPLAGDLLSPASAAATAVAQLRHLYAELGLPPSAQPDHIAVVLGTLPPLLGPTPDPARADRLRQRLVEDHLRHWVNSCLSRIQRGAQTFYYQGVGVLGLAAVRATVQLTSRTTLP